MTAALLAADESRAWVGCPTCGLACRLASGPLAAADGAAPRCPRCDEPLHGLQVQRPVLNAQRSWALLLASVLAYVPANLLPIMSTTSALTTESHTLFGGIAELWHADAWVLATIVFIASVAVPMLKIVALVLLVWTERQAPRWRRHDRAALFRLVEAVGHWSMLDVYVVVLLAAMVHFGGIASVTPEPGLLAFAAMVILTLLAAHSIDSRRIWQDPAAAGAAS